jgi:hypothetical protein
MAAALSGLGGQDVLLQSRITARIDQDPKISADDVVEVNVNRGVADIGGIVDDWPTHRQLTHDAFAAGAREVVNHARVRSDPGGSERRFVYRRDPIG